MLLASSGYLVHARRLTPSPARVCVRRVADLGLFQPAQGAAHHERSSNTILAMAGMSSGVRLVLGADADALRLVVRPRSIDGSKYHFDLVADGRLFDSRALDPQQSAEPLTVEFAGIRAAAGGGAQRVELWLPHRAAVTVMSLEVSSSGAVTTPVRDMRPRWITHGSSITHGIGGGDHGCAHGPSCTWPGTAARLANVNPLNLGFGGRRLPHFQSRDQRAQPRELEPPHVCDVSARVRDDGQRWPPADSDRAGVADLLCG